MNNGRWRLARSHPGCRRSTDSRSRQKWRSEWCNRDRSIIHPATQLISIDLCHRPVGFEPEHLKTPARRLQCGVTCQRKSGTQRAILNRLTAQTSLVNRRAALFGCAMNATSTVQLRHRNPYLRHVCALFTIRNQARSQPLKSVPHVGAARTKPHRLSTSVVRSPKILDLS